MIPAEGVEYTPGGAVIIKMIKYSNLLSTSEVRSMVEGKYFCPSSSSSSGAIRIKKIIDLIVYIDCLSLYQLATLLLQVLDSLR